VVKLYQVDSFTDTPFSGNPAAVCVLPDARAEAWMQAVAQEMNLPETAFLWRAGDGFRLRWFTPVTEVEMCGHGTLASAHVLWEAGLLPPEKEARFHTVSGLLTAVRRGREIELGFPATPPEETDPPPGLSEALGVDPDYVGKTRLDCLVAVGSEGVVRGLVPDFPKLLELPARGVIVTSRAASDRHDFVSRYFAPAIGIDEDPVTGSAHCCLGPFWSARLGRDELVGYQASPRGGLVRVRVAGERVHLTGRAVTVLRGELVES
jgi:PhzF family phenazine biosynthesis protein